MNDSTTQSKPLYAAAGRRTEARLLSAATIYGDTVCNLQNKKLGRIQDVMVDITEGKICYAVLASGGFLGMGDSLFIVPWKALKQDRKNQRFMLDVDLDHFKSAPYINQDEWPNIADAD